MQNNVNIQHRNILNKIHDTLPPPGTHCSSIGRITTMLCTDLSIKISLCPLYLVPGIESLYLKVTFLTLPSKPGDVNITCPSFQFPFNAFLSLTSTISPGLTFRFSTCHLVLTKRVGKKSLIHFFQKVSIISLTNLKLSYTTIILKHTTGYNRTSTTEQ